MEVAVDREKAGELGVSVGQVGLQLRRSLFGEKAGVYKKDGDDYDINVRFNEDLRYNTSALFTRISFLGIPHPGRSRKSLFLPLHRSETPHHSAPLNTKTTSGW